MLTMIFTTMVKSQLLVRLPSKQKLNPCVKNLSGNWEVFDCQKEDALSLEEKFSLKCAKGDNIFASIKLVLA